MVGVGGSSPLAPTSRPPTASEKDRRCFSELRLPAARRPTSSPFREKVRLDRTFLLLETFMISVQLPDGSQRAFDHPVSVAEVAASIGPGLAKAALAGRVDGKLVDTAYRIERDAKLAIVTDKDPDGLEVLRHSTAHLL